MCAHVHARARVGARGRDALVCDERGLVMDGWMDIDDVRCWRLVSGRESNRNQDRSFCGSLVAGMFLYVMYETAVLIHTCVVLAGGNREVEVLEDIST